MAVAVLLGLTDPGTAQEPPPPPASPAPTATAWQPVQPLPRRFPRFTDANGCRWGLEQDGAVSLSGSALHPTLSLVRHAARLNVDGQAFLVNEAAATPDASRLRLTGAAGVVPVVRDIWIDRDRGGVRYADTVSNATDQPATVTLASTTVFDQPVPAIHRGDGAAIDDSRTDVREATLGFLQNQPEGMSSAVFILGDPKGQRLPLWKGKLNSEAQVVEWTLDLPPGGAITVVTWMVQRPTLAAGGLKALTEEFFKNGRLVRPRLEAGAVATLVNFPARGLEGGDSGEAAATGPTLAPLAQLAARLGIERGELDVYYMNPKSLLEGEAQGGPLGLQSRFGPVTVPLADVAAVQGGGGRGRRPRVFLRDGHVLTGDVTLPDWKISGAKGWAITLNPDTLEALVLRTSPGDGGSAAAPNFLVQLASGETIPLVLKADDRLGFVTPWGAIEPAVGEITGLRKVRQPAPAARLTLRDGSRLTVFPAPGALSGSSSRLGPVTLPAADLAALWPSGADAPDPESAPEEIATVEDLGDTPAAVALFRGSNVLAATLADPTITLLTGGTETTLSTADLSTLQRAEGSTDAAPLFVVTLSSGASFEGSIRSGSLALTTRGGPTWTVPLSHVLGWKQAETKDTH